MDESLLGLMEVVGPAILLIALIWLVMRSRRSPGATTDTSPTTEAATRDQYTDEEQRRRDGTDGL